MVVLLWILILLANIFRSNVDGASTGCADVRYSYSSKGMNVYDFPTSPQSGSALQICPQGPTCCTPDMENRLGIWTTQQFKDSVDKTTSKMLAPFSSKAIKLEGYMTDLFMEMQQGFDYMFTQTYGNLYTQNAYVFKEYFAELKNYFIGGRTNLAESTRTFFTTLYQKMFQVLNAQYMLDQNYLVCVAQHMDRVQPFGDIPVKISSEIQKSMVASRAILKAVISAFDIGSSIKSIPSTPECLKAVQKMNSCPACQGYSDLKPCSNYCLNVMKGCFVFQIETQNQWDTLMDSISNLSDRLLGPFNIEAILLMLDTKISTAIMNFQDNHFKVIREIQELCGPLNTRIPAKHRVSRRSVNGNGNETADSEPVNPSIVPEVALLTPSSKANKMSDLTKAARTEFEKIFRDLKNVAGDSKGFWRDLPYDMCDQPNPSFQEIMFADDEQYARSGNSHCWNGEDSGSYKPEVVADGFENLMKNPEMKMAALPVKPTIIKEEIFKLQSISHQLKLAHGGHDIEWWDEDTDVDLPEGSGAGAFTDNCNNFYGSGDFWKAHGDDEDFEGSGAFYKDCFEGSGSSEPEIEPESPWTPWTEPTSSTPRAPVSSTTAPEIPSTTTTEKPKLDSGSIRCSSSIFGLIWALSIYILGQYFRL